MFGRKFVSTGALSVKSEKQELIYRLERGQCTTKMNGIIRLPNTISRRQKEENFQVLGEQDEKKVHHPGSPLDCPWLGWAGELPRI